MPHRQFNADATIYLNEFVSRTLCLRRGTESRVNATREAIAQSRALIVAVDARLVTDAHTTVNAEAQELRLENSAEVLSLTLALVEKD